MAINIEIVVFCSVTPCSFA